jgi:hypothetical protein
MNYLKRILCFLLLPATVATRLRTMDLTLSNYRILLPSVTRFLNWRRLNKINTGYILKLT